MAVHFKVLLVELVAQAVVAQAVEEMLAAPQVLPTQEAEAEVVVTAEACW